MFHRPRPVPRRFYRPWLIVGLGLILLAVVSFIAGISNRGGVASSHSVASAPEAKPAPAARASYSEQPSFDIVRVDPQGHAVIAGRGEPEAEIVLRDGDREAGRVTSDKQGQWVMIPELPFAPGSRELTVESLHPDGTALTGDASVDMIIPDRNAAKAGALPLAVLTPQAPAAPPRLLQAPDTRTGFGLDILDYDEHGDVRFAGHAPAGATVRVYLDNRAIGDAVATQAHAWTLVPHDPITPGQHRLRLDEIGPKGEVLARVELPIMREIPRAEMPPTGRLIVQPGESLWRLARNTYGQGVRYTVIYQANHDQIRNPDLIYPGQIFSLPPDPTAEPGRLATPLSSSRSR